MTILSDGHWLDVEEETDLPHVPLVFAWMQQTPPNMHTIGGEIRFVLRQIARDAHRRMREEPTR